MLSTYVSGVVCMQGCSAEMVGVQKQKHESCLHFHACAKYTNPMLESTTHKVQYRLMRVLLSFFDIDGCAWLCQQTLLSSCATKMCPDASGAPEVHACAQ